VALNLDDLLPNKTRQKEAKRMDDIYWTEKRCKVGPCFPGTHHVYVTRRKQFRIAGSFHSRGEKGIRGNLGGEDWSFC
jgi:hypothetical protein